MTTEQAKQEGAKEIVGWIRGKFMDYPDMEEVDDRITEALVEYLDRM